MKKNILLAILILILQNAFAQDVIVKLNGEEQTGLVTEITLQDIYYQSSDSTNTTIQRIAKADVFMVRFANGTKEVFIQNLPESQMEPLAAKSPEQMYQIGRDDAKRLYKGNGALWGSVACVFAFPYGLAGTAAIGFTKPKVQNNPVSDRSYLSNPYYVKGYERQAHKKKTGKVLAGTGIGVVSVAALIVGVVAAYGY
jgi:hypothetical protein